MAKTKPTLSVASTNMTNTRPQLTIPAPAKWLNSNDRYTHWAVRHKLTRVWRNAAQVYARQARLPKGMGRVHLTVEVCRPRSNRADVGNFYPTVKAVVDGLTDYGCWVDDDDSHLVGPACLILYFDVLE